MENEPVEKNKIEPRAISRFRLIALFLGPSIALLFMFLPAPLGMTKEAWILVALIGWMVTWWLSEAIPIPATALLPIPFMPILGIGDMKVVASQYANPIIFLFLGGFIMAAAMQKWGLHKRIALRIVSVVGTNPSRVIGGFMLATAFLSMWISNTSATIMMYAVALSVIDFVARKTNDEKILRRFGVALMLGIAYSGTIGGVGTLIGTPPNALLASFLSTSYGIQIDFFTWMKFGVPIVLLMLPLAWLLLTKFIFPADKIQIGNIQSLIENELKELGPMSYTEKVVAGVFISAALGWIFRKPLVDLTGLPINDTSIALVAALVLFAWPVSKKSGKFILDWEVAKELPWGILLLFGGGLALSFGFNNTGLAPWIGQLVSGFNVSTWLLVLTVVVSIVYLTEITSNTASTATFLPILGAVAVGLDLDPRTLAVPAAVAASMAFMMPVATPPNAIVFTYEKMRLFDMIKAGFFLNIIAIIVTCSVMYLLAGVVFGI
ncbi:SLC13 family permease [Pseudocolwellia agarivorans]|uniref:SLC13 family permease n=1 Tax=Pseudocolwellia agarivorans TaxID=1911682 RepID=UPI0009856A94|nr:DASS family sodium-coupled anion symporter [Pseudocolwellia agarivorans]